MNKNSSCFNGLVLFSFVRSHTCLDHQSFCLPVQTTKEESPNETYQLKQIFFSLPFSLSLVLHIFERYSQASLSRSPQNTFVFSYLQIPFNPSLSIYTQTQYKPIRGHSNLLTSTLNFNQKKILHNNARMNYFFIDHRGDKTARNDNILIIIDMKNQTNVYYDNDDDSSAFSMGRMNLDCFLFSSLIHIKNTHESNKNGESTRLFDIDRKRCSSVDQNNGKD